MTVLSIHGKRQSPEDPFTSCCQYLQQELLTEPEHLFRPSYLHLTFISKVVYN